MRSISLLLTVLVTGAVFRAPDASPTADPVEAAAILRLEVAGDSGAIAGTCFLVHKEQREKDVALYFLSAAHLFEPFALGESRTARLRVRIVDGESAVEASGSDVLLPGATGPGLDVAIIKVVVPESGLVPVPVVMQIPAIGDVFMIGSVRGIHGMLTGRTQFRSTRLVIADKPAADEAEVGAPAILPMGVFGVVTDAAAGSLPVVTLLSVAEPFLTSALPGWQPIMSTTPSFAVEERRFDGPILKVACDAVASGDVEVPYSLRPQEAAVDVAAAFTNPRALRLGDLTVASLEDRVVRLRFTMAGEGPSPIPIRAGCPSGQALVSVKMHVVVLPRP